MDDKVLDLKTLPLVGFDFLAQYWMAVNNKASNVLEKHKRTRLEVKVYSWQRQKDKEYDKVQEDD